MLIHLNSTYFTLTDSNPTRAIPVSLKGFVCRVNLTMKDDSDSAILYLLDTEPNASTDLVLHSLIPPQTITDKGVIYIPEGLGTPFVARNGFIYAHIKFPEGSEAGTYNVGICWRTNDS